MVTSYTTERLNDIRELLDSLQAQTYPHLEIIFVGERTLELGERLASYAQEKGIANLRTLFNGDQPGLSQARNLGARQARGEIIAFVDDDAVVFTEWAQELVSTFAADPSAIGVTGAIMPLWSDDSLKWLPEEFWWVVSATGGADQDRVREVRNGWGTNLSFRREAFQVCQFDDSTFGRTPGLHTEGKQGPVGDETEFCIRLCQQTGKRILFNPRVQVWHRVEAWRFTPRFVRRQAFWQGYTRAMLQHWYGGSTGQKKVLATEYALLRRILFRLLPRTVLSLLWQPVLAWKRLSLAIRALFYLALGYWAARVPRLGRLVSKHI